MRPQTYRDVDLPATWDEWDVNAKVNYLCTVTDRNSLMQMIGEKAGVPDDEIGPQSIHKAGLAQVLVALTEGR